MKPKASKKLEESGSVGCYRKQSEHTVRRTSVILARAKNVSGVTFSTAGFQRVEEFTEGEKELTFREGRICIPKCYL